MAGVATDMGKFFRSAAVYGTVGALRSFGEFLLLPLYTRYLLPAEFAVFDVTLVYLAILTVFVSFELTNGAFRFHFDANDYNYHRRLASSVTIYLGCVAGAAFLITLALAPTLSTALFGTPAYHSLFILAGLFLVIQSIYTYPLNMLRLQNRPGIYSVISLIQVMISLGGAIMFVAAFRLGVEGLLLAKVLSGLPTLIGCLWIQRKYLRPIIDLSLIRKLLTFCAPLIPAGSAVWLVNAFNRTALLHFTDLTQTGLFALASKFTIVVTLAVMAIQLAWPQFAFGRLRESRARQTFAKIFSYYTAGALWLVLIISLLGDDLLRLQSATAYLAAARLIPPLALGMLFYGCFYLFMTGAAATKTTRLVLPPVLLGLAMNGMANTLLTPRFGAAAVAWVTPLTYAVMAGVMLRNAQAVFPIPFAWGKIMRAFLVAGILFAGTALLPLESWFFAISLKVVIIGLYPILLQWAGFYGEEELDQARRILRFARRGEPREPVVNNYSRDTDTRREVVRPQTGVGTDEDCSRVTKVQSG